MEREAREAAAASHLHSRAQQAAQLDAAPQPRPLLQAQGMSDNKVSSLAAGSQGGTTPQRQPPLGSP